MCTGTCVVKLLSMFASVISVSFDFLFPFVKNHSSSSDVAPDLNDYAKKTKFSSHVFKKILTCHINIPHWLAWTIPCSRYRCLNA